MPIDYEGVARREANTRLLQIFGLGGLILIIWSNAIHWAPIENILRIFSEIGVGLIVAALLGWLVDRSLKLDLIRNAVAAAIGYLLPDTLKAELNWVYDQKFIASQTFQIRLEHFPEKKTVFLYGRITRIIKNTSGEQAELRIGGGTEEWFHDEGESQVTKWGYTKDHKFIELVPEKNEVGIGCKGAPHIIAMEAKESIELIMAYTQVRHEAGLEILTYGYPIENPLVTVDVPETLRARVVFSHRAKFYENSPLESGYISSPLDGLLLPHQDITVYWYLATKLEERRIALNPPALQSPPSPKYDH